MVTIEAIDDAMNEEIEKRFPVGEDLDEKTSARDSPPLNRNVETFIYLTT